MAETKAKNSKFMDLFGDLASDNTLARNKAGTVIVKYLIHTQGGVLEASPKEMCPDLEYSVRRLVRGLSSSRQSARQGFAACLCEVLLIFDFIRYSEVIELIDDTTKVTGSMKRAEERDVMFGKLFGYLTLIAAKRVTDTSSASDITERLLVLYDKKPWMHEISTEALLSALSNVAADQDAVKVILDKLAAKAILFGSVDEMTSSQLMLLIGLQHHFSVHPEYNDLFLSLFSYKHPVNSLKKIESFAPALIASCSGYPKIHRVWDYLLSGVFGFDEGRHLCSARLSVLSPSQDKALGMFVSFIDKHLINSTQEKRGVAMALATSIAARVPITLLSKGLSQSVVRCLIATRMNKKHTLFVVAGQAIDAMVSSTGTSEEKLALATTFIQHGSPSFDAKTSTKAVATLLAGADKAGVLAHVTSICGIVGTALASILNTPLCKPTSEPQATKRVTDLNADTQDESDSAVSVAISGIAELAGMVKNNSLPGRAEVFEIVLAVLVRLSCFGVGGVKSLVEPNVMGKTPKKDKKKVSATDRATGLNVHVASALTALENALVQAGSAGAELNLPASITDAAASRLVSSIADMGHVSISQLENAGKPTENAAAGPTVLDYSTNVLGTFLAQGGFFCFHGYGVGNTSVDDFGEGSESETAVVAGIVKKALAAYKDLSGNSEASKQRVVSAFKNLLGQALFHVLITTDISLETMVSIISEVIPKMTGEQAAVEPAAKKRAEEEEEDSDDDDEEESVQLLLFEGCVDLLSVPGTQHPIKGIRDAIKKVWSAISQSFTIDYELVASVVEFIAGEEGAEGGQSKGEHGHEYDDADDNDEVDEENSDDESVDSQADAIRAAMLAAAGGEKMKAKVGDKRRRDESESDDSDNEDVVLGDDAFDMLPEDVADSSGDDSESGSEQGLQHTEEADDALVNMLQLKRQNRKKGLLEAKRIQLLNRTRAVDILEAIVSRNSTTGYLMVPMFTPLLRCLKKCIGSTFIRSLQEGRAFENRLKGLFEAKLCKEKFHLVSAEETSEELCVEIDNLAAEGIQYSAQLLNSTESVVRQVALSSFVALLRATVSTTSSRPAFSEEDEEEKPAKEVLVITLQSVFEDLFSKRNSRIPVKLFHDITERFPDYVCEHLLEAIANACSEAKTSFLRAEACKLINVFIKKFKSLSTTSQQAVISAVSKVSYAVSQNLLTNVTESVDNKSKRLRPIMELSRDMLKLLIGQNKNGTSAGSTFTIEKKSVDALSQLTQLDSAFVSSTKSSVIKRVAEQIVASIKQIPDDNIVNSDNSTKKKKAAALASTPGKKGKRKMSDVPEEAVPSVKSTKKPKKK